MRNNGTRKRGAVSGLLISSVALILFGAALFPLSKRLAGWFFFRVQDEKELLSAIRYDSGNAAYHYLLGKYHHMNLNSPDIPKAIESYRNSLSLNPIHSGVWIDLSKAYQINNQKEEAEHALERAVRLSPNNPDLLWEAGTFWLMNSMPDKAVKALRQYLILAPQMQPIVYDLCWKLRLENSFIIENVVPPAYEYQAGYLTYLMSTKRVSEALYAWRAIDLTKLEKKVFISYSNFLIENGVYESAETVWTDITAKIEGLNGRDANTLLWNHDFEAEPLNGGFDWRIAETEGVNAFIDDTVKMTGNRSLGVAFDGLHNPDITIAQQTVIITPGASYSLRGYIKAEGITTKNGIFLQVQGHRCTGLDARTESVAGSSFWREVTVDFEAPPSCSAAVVKIRRERSQKLDNKIEGTAWIDGITLKRQAALQTNSSKKHTT